MGDIPLTDTTHKIRMFPLDELPPADQNPKLHDITHLRQLISRFGYTTPGLLDGRTGKLIVGHGRREALLAMRADGEIPPRGIGLDDDNRWLIPVITGWSSTSDAEASAYLVGDNQATINGGWNNEELQQLLQQIGTIDPTLVELTGVDVDALNDMIKANEPPDLDDLANRLGDPEESDTWPSIRITAPPHIVVAWRDHASLYAEDDYPEAAALAELLKIDLEK
jgi:hypothetical protein